MVSSCKVREPQVLEGVLLIDLLVSDGGIALQGKGGLSGETCVQMGPAYSLLSTASDSIVSFSSIYKTVSVIDGPLRSCCLWCSSSGTELQMQLLWTITTNTAMSGHLDPCL